MTIFKRGAILPLKTLKTRHYISQISRTFKNSKLSGVGVDYFTDIAFRNLYSSMEAVTNTTAVIAIVRDVDERTKFCGQSIHTKTGVLNNYLKQQINQQNFVIFWGDLFWRALLKLYILK